MVTSKESQNSCHFSVSPLNFLNGNQMLVFSFRMPAFPASALSFSSSISFPFSFILSPSKSLWASNSSFVFSRFSLSSSILSWLRNLSFSISAVSPFISLCFFVPSATDFFPLYTNCFSFPSCSPSFSEIICCDLVSIALASVFASSYCSKCLSFSSFSGSVSP